MQTTHPMLRLAGFGGALLVALALLGTAADGAVAKGGKITACVTKSGALEIAKAGKCAKGERKLTWNKKGKRGKAGEPGAAGAPGQNGQDGSAAGLDQLQLLVDQQGEAIAGLTSQLNALDSQVDGIAPQVAALCTQVSSVTGQSDALLTVLGAVNTILDPLTLLPLPTLPSALGNFSCH